MWTPAWVSGHISPNLERQGRIALTLSLFRRASLPVAVALRSMLAETEAKLATAAMFCNFRIDHLGAKRLQPAERPFLIRPHQTRIARDIGGEDGSEAADSRHVSPGSRLG